MRDKHKMAKHFDTDITDAAFSFARSIYEDELPVHCFHTLMSDLASLARNTTTTAITPDDPLTVATKPTPIQHQAFRLFSVAM
jgi:hypothetical protein